MSLHARSKAHLVPADPAVTRVRRSLPHSVKRVMKGEAPLGMSRDLPGVSAGDASLADDASWEEVLPSHRRIAAAWAQPTITS